MKNTSTNVTYTSLQAAYDAAETGQTVKVQSMSLAQDFTAGAAKSITIEGGCTCDFASTPGMTTLNGAVAINNGTVNLKNFIVSQ